jgi:hypothetical protein
MGPLEMYEALGVRGDVRDWLTKQLTPEDIDKLPGPEDFATLPEPEDIGTLPGGPETDIPVPLQGIDAKRDWLTKRLSPEDFARLPGPVDIGTWPGGPETDKPVPLQGIYAKLASMNPLREFFSQLRPGDEAWAFCSPAEIWALGDAGGGRKGYCILRQGEVVAVRVTRMA